MAVLWLGEDECHEPSAVGGKAATLSKLAVHHRVPPGFALDCEAARGLAGEPGSRGIADGIRRAYAVLAERCAQPDPPVAVRSSAIDEDGTEASFAGQHETFLNVRGADAVLHALNRCVASASSREALAYRAHRGDSQGAPAIAVLVQALVPSDVSAVAFSANPISGSLNEIIINASWGLGESIVGGTVTPDAYVVRKSGMQLVSTVVAQKVRMTVLDADGTREVGVPRVMQSVSSLDERQVVEVARLALALEERFATHVDVECAFSRGDLYLLQCRPITTLGQ